MKTLRIMIGLASTCISIMAGTVTIPNTFEANTTAKATEVNANFSTLEDAINDNTDKITTNTNNIAANKTAIDQKITDIIVGGGLKITRTDNNATIKRASGYVSIHPVAYISEYDDDCKLDRGFSSANFSRNSIYGSCDGYAHVSLPDRSQIISLNCAAYKNDGQTSSKLDISLYRLSIEDQTAFVVAGVELEAAHNADSWEPLETTTINTNQDANIVDNQKYAYVLNFNPPNNTNTSATEKNKIGVCTIGYTY